MTEKFSNSYSRKINPPLIYYIYYSYDTILPDQSLSACLSQEDIISIFYSYYKVNLCIIIELTLL
jgi:hypothetical protein